MSASDEWTDWHLTPNGWKAGTEKRDHGTEEKIPPDERVLTVRWCEYLGAVQGTPHRYHEEKWRSKDADSISALLSKYGNAPSKL